jgi:hypothetical protein
MAMGCYRHVSRRYNRDWFGVVATTPRITQGRGDEEMTYRRTFREWATDAAKAARQYGDVAIALAMMAGAAFAGTMAAHWVFGP